MEQWKNDDLWDSALILAKEQHYKNSFVIIKAIALQTVQATTRMLVYPKLSIPTNKSITVEEILTMKALSNEIFHLLETGKGEETFEKTTEYLNHLVLLLAESPKEEESLQRALLSSFVEATMSTQINQYAASLIEAEMPTSESKPSTMYTASEAAEHSGVSDQTIRRWCAKGVFPEAFQTEGSHWRIPKKYFEGVPDLLRNTEPETEPIDDGFKQLEWDEHSNLV